MGLKAPKDEVMARVMWDALNDYARAEKRLRRVCDERERAGLVQMSTVCRRHAIEAGADEHKLQLARMDRLREIEYMLGRKGGDYRGR